jgi:hypothetical protein
MMSLTKMSFEIWRSLGFRGQSINPSPNSKAWEPGAKMSKSRKRWIFQFKYKKICPFHSPRVLNRLDGAPHIGGQIFICSTASHVSSSGNNFTEIILYHLPGHPLAHSNWHIKLLHYIYMVCILGHFLAYNQCGSKAQRWVISLNRQ